MARQLTFLQDLVAFLRGISELIPFIGSDTRARIHPVFAPIHTETPYITYTKSEFEEIQAHDGPIGYYTLTIIISCFAKTATRAQEIADIVIRNFDGLNQRIISDSRFSVVAERIDQDNDLDVETGLFIEDITFRLEYFLTTNTN